ncbi:MAG: ATP-binding protein [Bacteroidota bacterium]
MGLWLLSIPSAWSQAYQSPIDSTVRVYQQRFGPKLSQLEQLQMFHELLRNPHIPKADLEAILDTIQPPANPNDTVQIWHSLNQAFKQLGEGLSADSLLSLFGQTISLSKQLNFSLLGNYAIEALKKELNQRELFQAEIKLLQLGVDLAQHSQDTLRWVTYLAEIRGVYALLNEDSLGHYYGYQALNLGRSSFDQITRIFALAEGIKLYAFDSQHEETLKELERQLRSEDLAGLQAAEKIVAYEALGLLYRSFNRYNQALIYYQKVLSLNQERKQPYGVAQNIYDIGAILLAQHRYQRAIQRVEPQFADSSGLTPNLIGDLAAILFLAHEKLENFQEAITYQRIWAMKRGEVQAKTRQRQLYDLEMAYQIKLKEARIDRLSREIELEESTKTNRLWLLFGTLFLLSVLGIFTFRQKLLNVKIGNQKMEIEAQRHRLSSLDQKKSSFFQNLAHELRTPLTLVYGPVHKILKESKPNQRDAALLHTTLKNCKKTLSLLNQMLHVETMEKEELWKADTDFLLHPFLMDITASLRPQAEFQEIQFDLALDIAEGTLIRTDQYKLQSILQNLLSNATRFNKKGGHILFQVSLSPEGYLQALISDTGRGISDQDLPHIFEPFFQGGNPDHHEGGSGIGLAITRDYLRLLGGSITVETTPSKGSVFHLSLPVELISHDSPPLPLPKEEISTLYSPLSISPITQTREIGSPDLPLILVVEDHVELSHFVGEILAPYFRFHCVPNGLAALRYLQTEELPDLLITDLMMPEMDGWNLVRHLRKEEQWHKIPFLVLTAREDYKSKILALENVKADYLSKPFTGEELILRIEYLLEIVREQAAHQQLDDMTATGPSAQAGLSTFDGEWLQKLSTEVASLLENNELQLVDLADVMCVSIPHLHRRVKSLTGRTPMQYIQDMRFKRARLLLERNPYTSVKQVAHSVGFKAEKNFSRNFKKRYGKYPSELLASLRTS